MAISGGFGGCLDVGKVKEDGWGRGLVGFEV